MNEFSKRIAELSPEKLAVLMERLADRGENRVEWEHTIPRRSSDAGSQCELSFAQERLWFLDRLGPGSPAYNLFKAIRLRGTLRLRVFHLVFRTLFERHETLRTTFRSIHGKPMQCISPVASVSLPQICLAQLSQARREAEALRLVSIEARRPFDLEQGPLLRVHLVRLSEDTCLALLTMHHIVGDQWSIGNLVRELVALYDAFLHDRPSPLEELPIQYADFALWQRRELSGPAGKATLAYWSERLAGAPALLELATDRPRPAIPSGFGSSVRVTLPSPVARQLDHFARQHGASLFMALLAIFKILLYRYAGQGDLVVGTPVTNRDRVELEGLIGFLVNTLALRSQLGDEPNFVELLARVRRVALEAFEHQNLPFEKLVAELRPERSLSHTPLFQVMFVLHNATSAELELAGLSGRPVEVDTRAAKFDLTLNLEGGSDGVAGALEYSLDRLDHTSATRLARHLTCLVHAVLVHPQRRLSQIPLLHRSERHAILAEFNDSHEEPSGDGCLHHWIANRAAAVPDACAVVFGDCVLSYRELRCRSKRLAGQLRRLGVGPDQPVGLCVERSLELVVAMVAILEAGGAYVPIDPSYPAPRLRLMLDDSAAEVVIVDTSSRARLPRERLHDGVHLLIIDERLGSARPEISGPRTTPQNLAYILYTSGSSGHPKGVAVTHRGLLNLLRSMGHRLGFSPTDAVLALTTVSFDIAALEIFLPLLRGALLVVAPRELAADGFRLQGALTDARATFVQATPATWRQVITAGWQGRSGLKVLCGGEALSSELAEELRGRVGTLWNGYGPTEAAIYATVHEVDDLSRPMVPIGRPIANTRGVICNPKLRMVPVLVPGELVIGGVGVARGYWQRPRWSAEKFVPDAFAESPGTRLYRTGDLVRLLPEARLDFVGRIDRQVKVRGFRIELGDVEVALEGHDAVREAVTIVYDAGVADRRLAAYFVQESGEEDAEVGQLRQYLRMQLPQYMVPSHLIQLEELPLTPNGKVNRLALPAPSFAGPAHRFAKPRFASEAIVTDIWSEVLQLERVGIHDDFFELGGHSLLMTQVVARVRRAFGVELSLRRFFAAPTVAQLAVAIEEALRADGWRPAPPIEAVQRGEAFALSYAQERLWFLDQLEPGNPAYNIPLHLQLEGPLDLGALERSFETVIRRHESLRTVFPKEDGEPRQQILSIAPFVLPRIDLRTLSQSRGRAEAKRLAGAEAHRPFDLSTGPLLRVHLLLLDREEHLVLLTLHHMVGDGWSLARLVDELATLYGDDTNGRRSELPELTVQYVDYAQWQRRWLQGEELEQRLSFWRRQLAGMPTVLELPADRPRPAVRSAHGAAVPLQLSEALSTRFEALSRAQQVTLFMSLLAAFAVVLARYAHRRDIVLGTTIAGRDRVELEPLIGLFVNTLVLRCDVSGDPSFLALLERVREVSLGAYAHQNLPFEKLVEDLQPRRDLGNSPLVQVMFELENVPRKEVQLGPLHFRPLSIADRTAKFDLGVMLFPGPRGVVGSVQYSGDLFDGTTVARLVSHYSTLLEAAVAKPEMPVSTLQLMSRSEWAQLVAEWNDSARCHPEAQGFPQLFADRVALSPERTAMVAGDVLLSYRQLELEVDRRARVLTCHGAAGDVVVALLARRNLDFWLAALAVLRAGAAYLPLDPQHPPDRQAQILRNSGAALLIVAQEFAAQSAFDGGPPVLTLEDLGRTIPFGICPACPSQPETLSYVIYTSGSTGAPKGSMIVGRGMLNHLFAKIADLELRPADTVAQTASQCFDISVWQVLAPLLVGAQVQVVPDTIAHDPRRLLDCVDRHAISILETVPSLMRLMIDEVEEGVELRPALYSLRWLIPTGEALSPGLCRRWLAGYPRIPLLNAYGPTECSDDVAHHCVDQAPNPQMTNMPIGRPVDNLRLYVLDHKLDPVPISITGELCIVGEGLGRGYLNAPGQTAETFVPDPYSPRPGERLYRSGDLAQHKANGELVFLGRRDHQVKVRGFRIELAEVEEHLRRHPDVVDVAVSALQERSGARLVGYLVMAGDLNLLADQREVRRRLVEELRRRLPPYMIPSALVFLDSLPLTANGKIDRRSLPHPDVSHLIHELSGGEGHSPIEEMLSGVWTELLEIEGVGRYDDFFELGGQSLLATRLVSQIRNIFQVELSLATIFEEPTVAGQAAAVQQELMAGAGLSADPVRRISRDGSLPLSFSQERLWYLYQLEPDNPTYNLFLPLQIEGALEPQVLQQSFSEIVRRHEILRTVFAMEDGQAVQRIQPAETVPLPRIDLRNLPAAQREREVRRLCEAESVRLFVLTVGPLLRVILLQLDQEEQMILLAAHHMVFDDWSIRIFFRELEILYAAFSTGRPSPLPELAVQYADFAVWQKSWLQGEALDTHLRFWRRQLRHTPGALDLPFDFPRPPVPSLRGARRSLTLDRELSRALKRLSTENRTTLFVTMLAAYDALLYYLSGCKDIIVGMNDANRTRAAIEPLIGFFVNKLALRVDLAGDPTFRELLRQVREVTLEAYAHLSLPYEKVIEIVRWDQRANRGSFVQVKIEVEYAAPTLEVQDLTFRVKRETREAHDDLRLFVEDLGGSVYYVAIDYDIDLFLPQTIDRILRRLVTLFELVAADSEIRLSSVVGALKEADQQELAAQERTLAATSLKKLRYASSKGKRKTFQEQR